MVSVLSSGDGDVALQTRGLKRRFGQVVAVDGLDLEVPRRSVYGFLGPNGAGKTTTIRLLLGLLRPDAGEVRLFGRDIRRERLALLRRVGALVETPSLYAHLTGAENLEVIRRLAGVGRERIGHVLEVVRLTTAAHRSVRGYSLGMKQRLGIAAALLTEPELLLLDEPTNGLDPAGIGEMRDLIRTLPQSHGITVFLSSHLLHEVALVATHVGIVNGGRLVFQGALTELDERAEGEARLLVGVDRPDEARRVLGDAGWVAEALSDGRLEVDARSPDAAAEVNGRLVRSGLAVNHLALNRPTLEALFFQLTGS